MRYSDFVDNRCPKCKNLFDEITESVLITSGVNPLLLDADPDEIVLDDSEICWDTSTPVLNEAEEAQLGCSSCGIAWHSKMKD